MVDKQLEEIRPRCATEGCSNIALGVINHKWRCGECIARYDQKIKEAREKIFLEE